VDNKSGHKGRKNKENQRGKKKA